MRADTELWATLGLEPGSPSVDLRLAYRQLAKRLHPDASKDPGTARRFDRVVKAYKTLSIRDLPRSAQGVARTASPEPSGSAGPEDIFALGSVLAQSQDPEARVRAATRLGLSGRRSAWVFLRKSLFDPDDRVSAASVRAVAVLGVRQAGPELASLYARASRALRAEIRGVARGTGEPVFAEALRVARAEGEPLEALEAGQILAAIGS